MVCKACDKRLTKRDLVLDDELCSECLAWSNEAFHELIDEDQLDLDNEDNT